MQPIQNSIFKFRNGRRGLTVLEVLFATMVVVVGLIGIASILPIAARDAQEAAAHTNGLSLGLAWSESFFARGLHRPNPHVAQGQLSWVWYRDYSEAVPMGWENFLREGYITNPDDRHRVNVSYSPFEGYSFSVGQGDTSRRWAHQAVCIDPFTMASDSVNDRINADDGPRPRIGSYRVSVFPYFNERYDPVMDPFDDPTLSMDQPRMLRVGLASGQHEHPYLHGVPVARNLVANVFGSLDGLVLDDSANLTAEERNSLPASRYYVKHDGLAVKALTDGTYTWMATVVPFEPLVNDVVPPDAGSAYVRRIAEHCLVSFVVLNRHRHEFVSSDIIEPRSAIGDTDAQPKGERITRVYPLSGEFKGGAGGRVRLIASASVRSDLKVGDWLMLGRHFLIDPPDPALWPDKSTRYYPFLRWYRVVGISQDAAYGTLGSLTGDSTGPDANANVWARDVVLEGPDFAFGQTPTFATLVDGVVTVIERQVKLD